MEVLLADCASPAVIPDLLLDPAGLPMVTDLTGAVLDRQMNNRSKLPVIYLLPGLLCDEVVWAHQQASLASIAEIRIPVFRGMSSFREMALHVLRDAPDKFSVVGHSMGGRVALELMHLFPERIDKFVLMNLGVHPLQPGEANKRWHYVEKARHEGMAALAESWIPQIVNKASLQDSRLMLELTAMVLRNTAADYQGQIEAALTRDDQTLYLPAISHKVLLVCGADDTWSPPAQHVAIQASLKDAVLHCIPNAGHMLTMEQPEAVSRLLLSWFMDREANAGLA